MKRVISVLMIVLLLPLTLSAQNKKIVMLELVGTDSTTQREIIRVMLMDMFTHFGKYEALICSEIDHFMSESNFQESGMVSNEQRERLEQMSGCELMCITQITSEEDYSFIESRLIELQSGKTVKTAHQLMKNTVESELEKGCIQLATKLVGRRARLDSGIDREGSERSRSGEIYNPDGIELVYVAVAGKRRIMAKKAYYISKYEITQAQWRAVMGKNPSHFKGDNLPVEMVSWDDVQKFLARLNRTTGRNYRLPTEAEWEFAARGGSADSFCLNDCMYSGSNNIDDVGWYKNNSDNRTHPVGMKQPNELGIYDMTGNVWEWCDDKYKSSKRHRCVRGGSWYRDAEKCNVFFRAYDSPNVRSYNLGFRVVLLQKK